MVAPKKRAKRKAPPTADWEDLRRRLVDANGRTPPDLESTCRAGEAPEPYWASEYIGALQRSIEGKNDDWLLGLVDACAPLHPQLLRLIAVRLRNSPGGRSKTLTVGEESMIAIVADLMTEGPEGEKLGWFEADEAKRRGVSKSTVRRAVKAGREVNNNRRSKAPR